MYDDMALRTTKSGSKAPRRKSRRVSYIEIIAAIVLTGIELAAAISATFASSPGLTPERQRELAEFVRQDCGSCHGMTLKGGLGRPLSADMFEGRGPDIIAEIILDGIPGTAMPPWRGLLTQAEADWIAGALKRGEIR